MFCLLSSVHCLTSTWWAFWTASKLSVEGFGCCYLRCVHKTDKLEGFSLALSLELFLNAFDSTKNPGEQTWLITIDWQISWFVWVFAGSKLLSIQCAPISYNGLVTFIFNNALIWYASCTTLLLLHLSQQNSFTADPVHIKRWVVRC